MEQIYSESFYDLISRESYISAREVLSLLFKKLDYRIERILDVGCGFGSWLAAARDLGIGHITGTDGNYVPRDHLMIKESEFFPNDLSKPNETEIPSGNFDMVLSMEVAEHLDESAASDFVALLTKHAPVILFSAAIPYQGGHSHRNENWLEYWVHQFFAHRFVPADLLRGELWHNDNVCWWYRQNVILFVRDDMTSILPADTSQRMPGSIIHPLHYINAIHRPKIKRRYGPKKDMEFWNSLKEPPGAFNQPNSYGEEYSYQPPENREISTLEELREFNQKAKDAVIADALAPIKYKNVDVAQILKQNSETPGRLPDFLCIGVQKSATTWLYEVFKSQPSLWVPPIKELNFFNAISFEKDSAYSGSWRRDAAISRLRTALNNNPNLTVDWFNYLVHLCSEETTLEWYKKVFAKAPKDRLAGEITPEYAMLPKETIGLIKELNPDIKIVLLLRTPEDRNLSHLKMINARAPGISKELNHKILALKSIQARSDYPTITQNWQTFFDESHFLSLELSEIESNPSNVLEKMYKFLNVDLKWHTVMSKKVYVSEMKNATLKI